MNITKGLQVNKVEVKEIVLNDYLNKLLTIDSLIGFY